MTLSIQATSTVGTSTTTTPATSGTVFPNAQCILVALWSGNSVVTNPPSTAPTITDNLGVHLTWTLQAWERRATTFAADGQVAIWTAPVTGTPASTSVSVTNGATTAPDGAVVLVSLSDTSIPTVGAVGSGGQSSGTTIAATIASAQASGSFVLGVNTDWDVKGAQTAGSGTTLIASAAISTQIEYTFARRTTADTTASASSAVNTTIPTASTNIQWAVVEIKAAAGGGATGGVIQSATPGQTWKRHFQHHQTRQLDPPPAAPTASTWLPGLTIPRRSLRKVPFFRSNPGTDVPDGNQLQPPSVRKGQIRSRRRFPLPGRSGSLSAPPDVLSTFVSAKRRTRRVPKLTSEGDSYSPPWTQTVPVNPAITQTVTGRVRAILRGQRRGQTGAGQPTPAQIVTVTNPAITQLTTGRFLRVLQRQRRGATGSAQWTPEQGQPPKVATRSWRKAFRPRYGRTPTVVPPQQAATPNPAITQFGSLWAKRWTMRRYGRVANPTPAQQAAPVNPSITQLVTGRAIKVLRGQRRGKTGAEQWRPAQQAVAANPSITQLVSVRIRLVIRGLRRPQVSKPVPEQVTPLPPTHHAQRPMASRRGRVSGPPIPQPVPPPRLVVERVKRPTRRIRRALGRFIPGGTAPTSTAVSSVGSTPPTVSEVGSISAEVETESATGPGGVGSVSGIDETGSTSGSGMTGSAS